jgi:predicted ATPase
MKLNVHIENFGKIKSADISIKPFTVIAGVNSSGKSFITKALYSFFSTINKDYITVEVAKSISDIRRLFDWTMHEISRPNQKESHFISKIIDASQSIDVESLFSDYTYTSQILRTAELRSFIKDLEESIENLTNEMSGKKKFKSVEGYVNSAKIQVKNLKTITERPTEIISKRIQADFVDSLKENFQVSSLGELKSFDAKGQTKFNFDTLGHITIDNEYVDFSLKNKSIDEFQDLYNVVYLESPIYWKIRDALQSIRKNNQYTRFVRHNKNDYLTGIPKHFFDLLDLLGQKLKDDSENANLSLRIREAISGKFAINTGGEISFIENGAPRALSLHTTALGITNLGIISLLLERGVLAKGSFLFIDEPEVNLHPDWQRVMVETLFELSQNGMNIVIASHSIDMMKCIDNKISSLDPSYVEEHFGFNQLSSDGYSIRNEDENNFQKISSIKMSLGSSFLDMFLE